MTLFFESDDLDFAANEGLHIEVHHNLGACPDSIQFMGVDGENLGFPTLLDENDDPIPGPYLTQTRHPNTIRVHKPDAYTFTAKFRVSVHTK